MAKLVELRKLSKEFYKAYPHNEFPEMESKLGSLMLFAGGN